MGVSALNNIVTLLQIDEGLGHSNEETVVNSSIVWANVYEPSISMKNNAFSVGRKVDTVMNCYRNEFCKYPYTHVDINGERYRITSTGASANDLLVKVTLARR